MIPEGVESSVGLGTWAKRLGPPLALMLLTAVLAAGGDGWRLALRYERNAVEAGEWWRIWTAHLVHLGGYHLMLNAAALAVWMLLCPRPWSPSGWLLRYGVLAAGVGWGLYWLHPAEANYVGLSGVVHGLFVLGLLPGVIAADGVSRAALALLIAKLGWEQLAGAPVSDEAAIGGHVVTAAHLLGAVSAFGYAAIDALLRRKFRAGLNDNARGQGSR